LAKSFFIIAITRYLPAFSEETLILIYEFLVLLIMFALIAGSCFFIALAWQKKEK